MFCGKYLSVESGKEIILSAEKVIDEGEYCYNVFSNDKNEFIFDKLMSFEECCDIIEKICR